MMAFAAVERLIALRYLRARREEGFISVIAGFSLVGIALGVGTLIVVMAVMNGFRVEMLRQMSGISGQLGVQGSRDGLEATPDLLARLRAVPGVATRHAVGRGPGDGRGRRQRARRAAARHDARRTSGRARRSPPRSTGRPACASRYRGLCRSDDDKPIEWGTLKGFGERFHRRGRQAASPT